MIDHVADRLDVDALAFRFDDENGHAFGFLRNLVERGGAGEQDHQLGMLQARGPDLLAVDDVAVAFLDRDGLDLGGVGAGAGLGDAHGLQAQLAGRDFRKVSLFLFCRAMPEQGVHVVHLAVAAAGVAA